MTKVLITGATGNVGMELIKALLQMDQQLELYAGVRDVEHDKVTLPANGIQCVRFDFTDMDTVNGALEDCTILFLLRPPQISDVDKYFRPIIDACIAKAVQHIVFLSVQGVEHSSIIPHHKIEKLIVNSGIPYTFLRPAYFMQNFTTTLHHELVSKKRIYLPAGKAKFTLVDVRDIGAVAAHVLINISQHVNKSYALTSNKKMTFKEMAISLSSRLGVDIQFISPNLLSFFLAKKRENTPTMLILVLIMLHYFPRFQQEPALTKCVEEIIHRPPFSFEQFINDNKKKLVS